MGRYGARHKDKGPAAVPTRVVEDIIRQCRPAVVVGRYTARYLEQGIATSGAFVTTSGREGVSQAADLVMRATAGRGDDSEELLVRSLDVGGGEAKAMRCAQWRPPEKRYLQYTQRCNGRGKERYPVERPSWRWQ